MSTVGITFLPSILNASINTNVMETSNNEIKIINNVPYGTHENKLDIYIPQNPKGAIINIHGGGWYKGEKESDADLGKGFANEGYITYVPNYRLAPKALFPAQAEDILECLEFVKKSEYQFDKNKIAVTGSSAGGNLAVEMAVRTGLPIVSWSGLIALDSFMDKTDDQETAFRPQKNSDGVSASINQDGRNDPFYRWSIMNLVGNDRSKVKEALPIHRVSAKTGKMFLVNSLQEFIPAFEVMEMQNQLAKFNIPNTVRLVEGAKHAKGYKDQVWQDTINFINENI